MQNRFLQAYQTKIRRSIIERYIICAETHPKSLFDEQLKLLFHSICQTFNLMYEEIQRGEWMIYRNLINSFGSFSRPNHSGAESGSHKTISGHLSLSILVEDNNSFENVREWRHNLLKLISRLQWEIAMRKERTANFPQISSSIVV